MGKMKYMTCALLACGAALGISAWFYSENRNSSGMTPRHQDSTTDKDAQALGQATGSAPNPQKRKTHHLLQEADRVTVPKGNAAAVVQQLLPLADKGDARAALTIYEKLSPCISLASMSVNESQLLAYKEAGIDERAVFESLRQRRFDCEGSKDILAQRGRQLAQAAAAGLPEAQLLYATDSEAIIGNREEALKNPEKVIEYKSRSLSYLNSLVAAGSVDAMIALSGMYSGSSLMSEDPLRAYAYKRAAQLAMPEIFSHKEVAILKDRLNPEASEKAEAMAHNIYSSCCKN
ncbi:hypothetical protein NRY95_08080 [Xanthomonas campestris pv. phormiicola]|nr:hypothetical protein [Xanthomonas campestris pv. phormiicola]UYC17898.1 hypothetical protein NRY95_08080 [Xanthomonas campestris pv. phormiicola]